MRYQNKIDTTIINQALKKRPGIKNINSKKIFFSTSSLPSSLPSNHNKENIAAAVAVVKIIGLSEKDITAGVKNFKGLPYRLEKILEINSVT